MDAPLPTAIAESMLTISGVTLRVYVLNDGRRVINVDDAHALFRAWANGAQATAKEAEALARVLKGLEP